MRWQTISNVSFDKSHKTTRKEAFLAKMDELIPWKHWNEKYPLIHDIKCWCIIRRTADKFSATRFATSCQICI